MSVLREEFRAADRAQQSLFIAHTPYSMCKVASTGSFSRGDKSLHSVESLEFKWANHPGRVSHLCLRNVLGITDNALPVIYSREYTLVSSTE